MSMCRICTSIAMTGSDICGACDEEQEELKAIREAKVKRLKPSVTEKIPHKRGESCSECGAPQGEYVSRLESDKTKWVAVSLHRSSEIGKGWTPARKVLLSRGVCYTCRYHGPLEAMIMNGSDIRIGMRLRGPGGELREVIEVMGINCRYSQVIEGKTVTRKQTSHGLARWAVSEVVGNEVAA